MVYQLVALLFAAGLAAAPCVYGVNWSTVHKQTPASRGTDKQPAIRYGHTAAAYKGKLITSHGYYFDREKNFATWLSDTWAMSMKVPHRWEQLTPGIAQEAAKTAYDAGITPSAPCGRFGHADATLNDTLYMYGGHDGGISRHGNQNYEPGFDFDELWAFNFEAKRWTLMKPLNSLGPGKRYLHGAVALDNQFIVYGGLNEGQGDVWSFDLITRLWTLLMPDTPRSAKTSPGRRAGHVMTPVYSAQQGAPLGFVLYGGRFVDTGDGTGLSADSWFFDITHRLWRQLTLGSTQPPARKYCAEAHTYVGMPGGKAMLLGLIMGGTTTTPALSCTADAWAFTLDCAATTIYWTPLPSLSAPIYDSRAAADSRAVYSFGGHLCDLEKGQPFFYTNDVTKLPLKPYAQALASQGCHIDAKALLAAAPHSHGGASEEL